MPRGLVSDPEFANIPNTPESRKRARRHYAMGFLDRAGLSSRFIADAFDCDDGSVRRVIRSDFVRGLHFPAIG